MSADVGRVNARVDDEVHVAARQAALGLGLKFEKFVELALRQSLKTNRDELRATLDDEMPDAERGE